MVTPVGKLVGASLVTVSTVQLSPDVGKPRSTVVATQESLSVVVKMFAGAILRGAVVSETVIIWVADTVLPAASVTCHVTAVVPNEKSAGALFTGIKPPQLSLADALPISTAQLGEMISAGMISTGFSSSTTVIFWVNIVVLLALSVIVHVKILSPNKNSNPGLSF